MKPSAIRIIDASTEKWKIDTRKFNQILDLKEVRNKPLAIISINGATRSGKSFLLNHFIQYFEDLERKSESEWYPMPQDLFKWETGDKQVTAGIHIWSKPYIHNIDGEDVAVLLLDAQGLFDEKNTHRQNCIIFTFSLLLSSVMMYNQKNRLDASILQYIDQFSSFASNLVNENNNQMTDSAPAPCKIDIANKLIFLFRDFELPDYEYGYHDALKQPDHSQSNYFTSTFEGKPGEFYPKEVKQVRKNIQDIFPSISSYLFPHPGRSFVRDSVSCRPDNEFLQVAHKFVQLVVEEHLETKVTNKNVITGREFKNVVERIREICSQEEFFKDELSLAESHKINEYYTAINEGQIIYDKCMNEFLNNFPDGALKTELKNAHEEVLVKVHKPFNKIKPLPCTSHEAEFRQKFDEIISSWFEVKNEDNNQKLALAELQKINEYKSAIIEGKNIYDRCMNEFFNKFPNGALEIRLKEVHENALDEVYVPFNRIQSLPGTNHDALFRQKFDELLLNWFAKKKKKNKMKRDDAFKDALKRVGTVTVIASLAGLAAGIALQGR